jgi:single-strand DNA-binding protein
MIAGVVTGNLGRDAELKDAGSTRLLSFSVASTSREKGEKITTWVRCTLWGVRGEKLAQYLTKGTKVAVSGEFSLHEYNGKTSLQARVSDVELLGGGNRQDRPTRNEAPAQQSGGGYSDADYGGEIDGDPF